MAIIQYGRDTSLRFLDEVMNVDGDAFHQCSIPYDTG